MFEVTGMPRVLRYALPMQRGEDVAALQRLLVRTDPAGAGREIAVVDGLFGPATRRAVMAFQARAGLPEVDGVVGPATWAALRPGAAPPPADAHVSELTREHAVFSGGSRWRLTPRGVEIAGRGLPGEGLDDLATRRAFAWFGAEIRRAAARTAMPVELLVATACTEALGDTRRAATPAIAARLRREEPGYVSDAATPHRVSVGIMQTLVSTARQVLPLPPGDPAMSRITAATLEDPATSILAGACCIAAQAGVTRLDPPVVACAYNAGGVYEQAGAANHWRMRQYPIGTPAHADRFVVFFNQAMRLVAGDASLADGAPSFVARLGG